MTNLHPQFGFRRMTGAVVVLAIGAIAAKASGFIREILVSYYFGTSRAVDTYLVAGIIPTLFAGIIAGSFTIIVIPLLIDLRQQKGEVHAWAKFASPLLFGVGLILMVFSLVTFLAAPWIVSWSAPGFEMEAKQQAATMMRILSPSLFFTGFAGLLVGVLQSYQRFLATAIAPLMVNLGSIFFLIAAATSLGGNALPYGYLLGSVLMFLLVLIAIIIKRPPFRFSFRIWNVHIRKVLRLWFPLLIGSAVGQLDLIINRLVGSRLPAGSIAGLNYANLIYTLLPSIVIASVGTAIYPQLSSAWSAGDSNSLEQNMRKALLYSWAAAIPGAVFLVLFSTPVVRLAYQRGAFDANATWVTAGALMFYAPALITSTVTMIAIRVLYAMKNTITPLWISLISLGTSIAFNVTLVQFMDHRGLALATLLSSIVAASLSLFFLRKRLNMNAIIQFKSFFWLFSSALIAGGLSYGLDYWFFKELPTFVEVGLLGIVFLAIYLVLNSGLRSPIGSEIHEIVGRILRFSQRKRK